MDTDIFRSLINISTDYCMFEKDQVLTHDQLNKVVDYLDDQYRLTRVNLLGVGIFYGLRASVVESGGQAYVVAGRGLGVSTDGDLLVQCSDTAYDSFRLYDESRPKYSPYFAEPAPGGGMLKVYELLPKGGPGDGLGASTPLKDFAARTGKKLGDMAVVLFMESYLTDRDICTGSHCDNLGKDYRNAQRLLLVERASLGALRQKLATPSDGFGRLAPIAADRPLVAPTPVSYRDLANIYLETCRSIHEKITAAIPNIDPVLILDAFTADPRKDWQAILKRLNTGFTNKTARVQYYYDFLKDLVETFNSYRDLLYGETTVCCPDIGAFPKHLVLGGLAGDTDDDPDRTGCYPSPLTSLKVEQMDHARFLLRKFDAMVRSFALPPVSEGKIRVTPSMDECSPLEERAIPCYYRIDDRTGILAKWNYRLHKRGMDAWNYSYSGAGGAPQAGEYKAEGAAANPLTSQTGRFPFYRVEGHLGCQVTKAVESLTEAIEKFNLPIGLRAVLVDKDPARLTFRPHFRYTDIHRFHDIIRMDVANQLDETAKFGENFRVLVAGKVNKDVVDGETAKIFIKGADEKSKSITAAREPAINVLRADYATYKSSRDIACVKTSLSAIVSSAADLKADLTRVTKTEFTTPLDTMIGNTHKHWIGWLDKIIAEKEANEETKLVFSTFVSQNPAVEHFAGVLRGGTLVLVYDSSGVVVADFMLPYYCCEAAEIKKEKPDIPDVVLRPKPLDIVKDLKFEPAWLPEGGISILPVREKIIEDKLSDFKEKEVVARVDELRKSQDTHSALMGRIKEDIDKKLSKQQSEYLISLKDSISLMGSALVGRQATKSDAGRGVVGIRDVVLKGKTDDIALKKRMVEYLTEKSKQPGITVEKRKVLSEELVDVQKDLSASIEDVTGYLKDKNADVTTKDGDGAIAKAAVESGATAISDPVVAKDLATRLSAPDRVAITGGAIRVLRRRIPG